MFLTHKSYQVDVTFLPVVCKRCLCDVWDPHGYFPSCTNAAFGVEIQILLQKFTQEYDTRKNAMEACLTHSTGIAYLCPLDIDAYALDLFQTNQYKDIKVCLIYGKESPVSTGYAVLQLNATRKELK